MPHHHSLPLVLAIGLTVALGTPVRADEQRPEPPHRSGAQGHPGRAPHPEAAHGPGHPNPGHPGPGHPGDGRHDMGHARHEFHEHDVRRFSREDLGRWRGGRWRQEWHNGRFGWWWMVGGVWYFYERPVYPYPLVVPEVTYVEPPVAAPVVVVPAMPAPPPPVAVAPAGPPPQQFWYYCDNPPGYYPYVATCNGNYREVPIPADAGASTPPAR